MPITYDVIADEKLAIVKEHGQVTLTNCTSSMAALAQDRNFKSGYDLLINFGEATISIEPDKLRQASKFIKQLTLVQNRF